MKIKRYDVYLIRKFIAWAVEASTKLRPLKEHQEVDPNVVDRIFHKHILSALMVHNTARAGYKPQEDSMRRYAIGMTCPKCGWYSIFVIWVNCDEDEPEGYVSCHECDHTMKASDVFENGELI